MRRALLPLMLLLGCDPGAPVLARVQQPTIDDGVADAVFGQPSLTVGTEPPFPSSTTTHFPVAVAAEAQPVPTDTNPMFFVADTGASRILGVFATSSFASMVAGQFSYAGRLPNAGGTVSQFSLDNPLSVAFSLEQLAIADTRNHRVLFGARSIGAVPWTPQFVYGQANRFDTNLPNRGGSVGPDTLSEPGGVAFDATFDPGRLLISDTGNHRVLIFLITSPISTTPQCIGQLDCTRGEPNRGGVTSRNSLDRPTGLATFNTVGDPLRGYYVADTGNHRVLHFPQPSATNEPDLVYGQLGDFTTRVPSKGGVSASSLNGPMGVAVDVDGALYVADTGNHRVLHYPKGSTVADRVYGQPDFTSNGPAPFASPTRMKSPGGVAVTSNEVLVADTGFSRVLRFRRPCDDSTCNDGNPCTDDSCDGVGGCRNQPTAFSRECAPYFCNSMARACARPCDKVAAPCASPFACVSGTCLIPCFSDDVCATVGRTCVDGFCCDRACNGPCERCNQAKSEGNCVIAPEGRPPVGRFCAGEGGECGPRCNGFNGASCDITRAGLPCGLESCTDNNVNKRGRCDGEGACSSVTEDCAPFACEVSACRTSCRFDYDCAPGARCSGDVCVAGVGGAAAGGGCTYDPRANALAAAILSALIAISIWRRR